MSEALHCESCGGEIAFDQRYCMRCGKRLVAFGPPGARGAEGRQGAGAAARPDGAAAASAPAARSAAQASGFPALPADSRTMIANALMALVFGVFVGTALRPDLGGVLGAGSQVIQVPASNEEAPEEAAAPAPAGSAGSAAGPAPAAGEGAVEPPSPSLETTPVSTPAPETTPPTTPPVDGGDETEQLLTGTVVRANPVARSYAVASSGPLVVVHAAKLPQPGTRIAVATESLANGTFAEDGKRLKKGTRKQATFTGTVTFTDPAALTYVVSTRGASVLVHLDASKATAAELPQLGAIVTTTVSITKAVAPPGTAPPPSPQALAPPPIGPVGPATEPAPTAPPEDPGAPPAEPPPPGVVAQAPPSPCAPPAVPLTPSRPAAVTLWQKSLRVDGQITAGLDVEAIVQAACLQPAGLVLSADDLRESGKDLTLAVAPGLDLSGLVPGQAINATVTIGADGTYTLTGLTSDWGRKAADDSSQALGDQVPRRLRAARSSVTWRGWTRRPFVIAPRP